jgi:hypothetical protein
VNGPLDIDIIANMDGLDDGIIDSLGGTLPNPQFNGASVTPEPTTALLLIAGPATLLWSKRARQD